MSFLSKLFGKKNANTSVNVQEEAPTYTYEKPKIATGYDGYIDYNGEYDWDDEYFESIINEANLFGYTIKRDVHPVVFDASAHPKCYPITFLISKNGSPVLAVMIMNVNQLKARITRGTYEILEDKGIKYIRFFRELLNDKEYVLNRVKENLI